MWPLPELQRRVAGAILTGDLAAAAPAVCGDGLPPEVPPPGLPQPLPDHARRGARRHLPGHRSAARRGRLRAPGAALRRRPPADAALPRRVRPRAPDLPRPPAGPRGRAVRGRPRPPRVGDERGPARPLTRQHFPPSTWPGSRPTGWRICRTGLHPAWRLVRSRWPVLDLWQACRPGAGEPEDFRLAPAWTELLVGRDPEGDAVALRLSPGPSLFLRSLGCGRPSGCRGRGREFPRAGLRPRRHAGPVPRGRRPGRPARLHHLHDA